MKTLIKVAAERATWKEMTPAQKGAAIGGGVGVGRSAVWGARNKQAPSMLGAGVNAITHAGVGAGVGKLYDMATSTKKKPKGQKKEAAWKDLSPAQKGARIGGGLGAISGAGDHIRSMSRRKKMGISPPSAASGALDVGISGGLGAGIGAGIGKIYDMATTKDKNPQQKMKKSAAEKTDYAKKYRRRGAAIGAGITAARYGGHALGNPEFRSLAKRSPGATAAGMAGAAAVNAGIGAGIGHLAGKSKQKRMDAKGKK